MTRFIIDRSRWKTATHGTGETALWNPITDMQCCLGFVMEQCGVGRDMLDRIGQPQEVDAVTFLTNHDGNNTYFTDEAIELNDDPELTHEQRERCLVELFDAEGHELVFVGIYLNHGEGDY